MTGRNALHEMPGKERGWVCQHNKELARDVRGFRVYRPAGFCLLEWMMQNCLERTQPQRAVGILDPAVTCPATVDQHT